MDIVISISQQCERMNCVIKRITGFLGRILLLLHFQIDSYTWLSDYHQTMWIKTLTAKELLCCLIPPWHRPVMEWTSWNIHRPCMQKELASKLALLNVVLCVFAEQSSSVSWTAGPNEFCHQFRLVQCYQQEVPSSICPDHLWQEGI